ncbi:MAG: RNA methyltransferase [Thermodesulfovibrionales bacterium]
MKCLRITSSANPHIREMLSILRRRTEAGDRFFLIEGIHLVEMALDADAAIKEVFFTTQFDAKEEGVRLLNRLAAGGIRLVEVTGQIMSRLTDTETPQGIVAVVRHQAKRLGDLRLSSRPLLVVLDRIQDPGNLGTIIRTSDAASAAAVLLLPSTCDPFMQKTIRSTAGSIFNIPVIQAGLDELTAFLGLAEVKLAVASADAPSSLYEADLSGPIALVFGNEAQGVSSEVKEAADLSFRVPIIGKAESLNVATAAAVCVYEAVRQRRHL